MQEALNLPRLSELEAPRDWALPVAMRQRKRMLQAQDKVNTAVREIARGGHTSDPPCTLPDSYRGQAIDARMPDAVVRKIAGFRADLMRDRIAALPVTADSEFAAGWLGWVNDQVHALGAPADAFALDCNDPAESLVQAFARARCAVWWRRQLRRAVVRMREDEGRARGEVCKQRQLYVTDDTLRRRIDQNAGNKAMLAATTIESEDGEAMLLSVAADASVSNRGIRRGELMTRIRGCEEWAEAHGLAGLFTTNTTPSRFHAMRFGGGANPKHDPTDEDTKPRGAQLWLRNTWARARAQLQRLGVPFFGFRVAEPHHDGCPHWHMLLWTAPEHLDRLRGVLRAQWLAEEIEAALLEQRAAALAGGSMFKRLDLEAIEPGCEEHRFKAVTMEKGGAAGYIAKYIAKNIDDEDCQVEGALDEFAEGSRDLFGGSAAKRVEAWAAAYGIRQFQAIGQPPVTVWRELRRVDAGRAAGGSPAVQQAHEAATRGLARRADWCAYMRAQGGAMTGRDYRVRMLTESREVAGRYGMDERDVPLGVIDATRPEDWILSSRREWKPREKWITTPEERATWAPALGVWMGAPRVSGSAGGAGARAARAVHPWTRVNNCTDEGGVAALLNAGLVGINLRAIRETEPGGSQLPGEPPWKSSRASNPPLTPPSRPSSIRSTPSARA